VLDLRRVDVERDERLRLERLALLERDRDDA